MHKKCQIFISENKMEADLRSFVNTVFLIYKIFRMVVIFFSPWVNKILKNKKKFKRNTMFLFLD